MKIAIIDVGSNKLIGKNRENVSKFLSVKFLKLGINLSKIVSCQNSPEEINNTLNFLTEECVFVVGEDSSLKNFTIKKAIANNCGCNLIQDDLCINAVNNYYKRENTPPPIGYENEFYIPDGAVCFENQKSFLQSFVMYANQTIFFIPDDIDSVKYLFEHFIEERLVEDFKLNYDTSIIKTYGLAEKDILYLLKDLISNKYKILITTYANGLDVETMVRYNKDVDGRVVDDFLARIYEKLNKFVYASEEVSLETRVFELLKLTNKTIAIAENITGGNVSFSLLKNEPKMIQSLKESIVCPSAESKTNRLKLNPQTLMEKSDISVEGCYEMATGLLETSNADVVAVTSGRIDTNKKSQVVFIAIGDIDGIHVYKNVFSGNRDTILENITKTTLFYLIKKIKQNDLFFGQITV